MSAITTADTGRAWSPDVTAVPVSDAVPDALINLTSTWAGKVEGDAPAVRVPYIDDAAATLVPESGTIPESEPDLSEVLVYTTKISLLIRLSREQYSQQFVSGQLSESAQRAIVKKANLAYLTQTAPVSPAVTPPVGILNTTGIVNGGAVADNLDGLIDLLATIEGNGGTPSHIILDPQGWARLRKYKTGTGSQASLLGAGVVDTERKLLDLPVLVTPALSAGQGLVLDKSAIVSAVGDVMVATSEHAYFGTDDIGVRTTWRIGHNLVTPNRIGKFTVSVPTPAE